MLTRYMRVFANWMWRCPTHCNNRQSVVTETCFLNKSKKFYEIFLEMYMWVWEYPPNIISRETELDPKTVRQLNTDWREILQNENENEEEIHGLIGGEGTIVEVFSRDTSLQF